MSFRAFVDYFVEYCPLFCLFPGVFKGVCYGIRGAYMEADENKDPVAADDGVFALYGKMYTENSEKR